MIDSSDPTKINKLKGGSRVIAILFSYSQECNEELISLTSQEVIDLYKQEGFRIVHYDIDFVQYLKDSVKRYKHKAETIIVSKLQAAWSFDRVDPVYKAIMRVAICEMLSDKISKKAILIDDYVNITKSFLDNIAFVNGLLDSIASDLQLV